MQKPTPNKQINGKRQGKAREGKTSAHRWFGLMGWPMMSKNSSANTFGPRSIGRPDPLNMRPSMSSDTAIRRMSPVKLHLVCLLSIPAVPSNTCKQASERASKTYNSAAHMQREKGTDTCMHAGREGSPAQWPCCPTPQAPVRGASPHCPASGRQSRRIAGSGVWCVVCGGQTNQPFLLEISGETTGFRQNKTTEHRIQITEHPRSHLDVVEDDKRSIDTLHCCVLCCTHTHTHIQHQHRV